MPASRKMNSSTQDSKWLDQSVELEVPRTDNMCLRTHKRQKRGKVSSLKLTRRRNLNSTTIICDYVTLFSESLDLDFLANYKSAHVAIATHML